MDNVHFDLMDILKQVPFKTYDIMIANPPYVTKKEMKNLMKDVKNFEPHVALTDYKDGLTFYNRFAEIGRQILKPNAWIILEVGLYDHPEKVKSIFNRTGYHKVELIKDYNSDDRVLLAQP